jgi:membrane-associated PAP2 superfamily phosphatase
MLTPAFWRSHLLWPSVLLVAVFAVLEFAQLDRPIAQALYFDASRGWLGAGAGDRWAHRIVHGGGRWLVRIVAATALVCWLASFTSPRLKPWRRETLFVFLGIVLATSTVGLLKSVTNVDCPWDLSGFGGDRPYIPLFGDRPDDLERAKCFPGAHSSSGFALMAVYFVLRDRLPRAAWCALIAAILIGVAFSIGQEARGAHFLSHDLTSAAIVWWILLALYAWLLAPRAAYR